MTTFLLLNCLNHGAYPLVVLLPQFLQLFTVLFIYLFIFLLYFFVFESFSDYDGYDDVYGHSVEDDYAYGVSPSTGWCSTCVCFLYIDCLLRYRDCQGVSSTSVRNHIVL